MSRSILTFVAAAVVTVLLAACGLLDDVDRSGLEDRRSSFDIEGYVRDETGEPLEDVKMSRGRDGYGHVMTDDYGHYAFTNNNRGWDYSVTPSKPEWVFEPELRNFKDLDRDHKDQDFVGYPILRFEIAGQIIDANYQPAADVPITVEYGDTSFTVRTNDFGFYRAEGIPGRQDCCLTPKRIGCSFEPFQRCYEFMDDSHYQQDFIITCE